MSIQDFINRKKETFFVVRDANKLQLQQESLAKRSEELRAERVKLEEVRQLQEQVKLEESAIHNLRTKGSSDFFAKISANVKRLGEQADANRHIVPEKFEMQPIGSPFAAQGIRSTHAQSPFTKDNEEERL